MIAVPLALALALGQAPANETPAQRPPSQPAPQPQASPPAAPSSPQLPGTPAQPGPALPVLTLDETYREAAKGNLDLVQAQARLDQAKQLSWKAWSYYLPQITATGQYTRNEVEATLPVPQGYVIQQFPGDVLPPPGSTFPPGVPVGAPTPYALVPYNVENIVVQKRDQLSAQLAVRQAILSPQAWFGIAEAYGGERIAALNVDNGRREVLFGVAQVYFGVAGLKQAVVVGERQVAITRDHERDARVRYQAGTTPKVALLRAEIDRSQAEQDLKRAQNSLLVQKVALATLLGRSTVDFDVEIPPQQRAPTDAAALEQAALRDRPDVLASQQNLSLAETTRNAVYAQYAPSLGAFGLVNWVNAQGFTGKTLNWAIGLSATWTLFDGGLREATLRENQARVAEADAAYRSSELRAREEVQQSLLQLDSALANRAKAKEQVDLARENAKLIEVNYKAGAATYLEVTDANQQLLSAEIGFITNDIAANLAALSVQKAAGAFNPK